MARSDQLEMPGTEDKEHAGVKKALHAWLDAKDEQRQASGRVKLRHATLIERMGEAKIARYPYTDPASGKSKVAIASAEPKVKLEGGGRGGGGKRGRGRKGKGEDVGDRDPKPLNVSQADPDGADPFAAARRAVNDRDRDAECPLASGDPEALEQAARETGALEKAARGAKKGRSKPAAAAGKSRRAKKGRK